MPNLTEDRVFDDTLRQGLAVQLEQSPFLQLVSDKRIRGMLRLMEKPGNARLTPELADVAAGAFRRGASGYVLKLCGADELCVAVRRVLRGESYLSPVITKDTVELLLRTDANRKTKNVLSSRQREVLQLLAEGKTMKEIASLTSSSGRDRRASQI